MVLPCSLMASFIVPSVVRSCWNWNRSQSRLNAILRSLIATSKTPWQKVKSQKLCLNCAARHLYLLNWLRWLPDVNYQPSAITGSQAIDARPRHEPLRAAESVTLPHSIFAEYGGRGFDVHFADPAAAAVRDDYLPSQHAQICALRNPHDSRVSRSVDVY